MKLAKNIENIRLSRGLNKAEFGKLFNTTGSLVGRWERGIVVPNETRLLKLANYAGITVEELKYGDESERMSEIETLKELKELGELLIITSLNFVHPQFEDTYPEWSMVHDIGERLVELSEEGVGKNE